MMVDKSGSSVFIYNKLNEADTAQSKSLERLASGKRINSASDDPAGLAVSMALESQSRGLMMQISNRQDEVSLLQTAEGGMSTTSDAVQRISELSVQAANGTLTDTDRQAIQAEVDQLNQQIDQNANSTEYNTKKLLDGSLDITLQNGTNLKVPNMSATSLGTQTIDVTSQASASSALTTASQAIGTVSSERSRLGAISNGITYETQGLQDQLINSLAANSRIADADMALEVINLTKNQIQTQASTAAFRIDNATRSRVLQLLK